MSLIYREGEILYMGIEEEVEELRHRVEALEQLVRAILSKIPEARIDCSVPKIVYERRYEYVKVSEDELYGRIVRLGGFLRQVAERQRLRVRATEEGVGSEGFQTRETSPRTPSRARSAGEGEAAGQEGKVALQKDGQAWRKSDDGGGQQGNDVITVHNPLSGTISIAVTLFITLF